MADLQGAKRPSDPESVYRQSWFHYYNQRKLAQSEGEGGSRGSLEKQHRSPMSNDTLRWAMARENQVTLADGHSHDIFLQWWVNPSECQWKVGLRSAITKTSGGAVHHEISSASRFEMPILTIAFQAGIVVPGGYNHIDNVAENIMPHGVGNFYDFLDLLDQPNQFQGQPNYVNIFYVSPVHGNKGIWLRGFFDENGVQWTDSSNDPMTITNWTANFMVWTSNPPLNQLRRSFESSRIKSPIDNADQLKEKEKAEKTRMKHADNFQSMDVFGKRSPFTPF